MDIEKTSVCGHRVTQANYCFSLVNRAVRLLSATNRLGGRADVNGFSLPF